MIDKKHPPFETEAFDHYLESLLTEPDSVAADITPWKKAMDRVLWGVGLTTVTLNFWNIDTILPAFGLVMALLGFRSLRKDNHWFCLAYVLTILRILWFLLCLFLQTTVYSGEPKISQFLQIGTYLMLIPCFLILLSLRNGIRRVQKKAGLPPHGGTGLLIWYGILLVLGLFSYTGIAAWGLLIAYFFMIRNLILMSQELDEAGYTVSPAPVRYSDLTIKILYTAMIIIALMIGYCFCNQHPMNWQEATLAEDTELKQVLSNMGFPDHVLDDMTTEDIQALEAANYVIVKQQDYDVDQNSIVLTAEDHSEDRINGITEDQGERQLRTTFIAVRFAGDQERWRIIHHFQWLTDRDFCGTEAIQMWPTDHIDGWIMDGALQGRVLYDLAGVTYTSDYHSLGSTTYETNDITAAMLGQTTSTDVYATFSLPSEGENQRGYVLYDVVELADGYIIDSWFNYVHQNHQIQFPVQSAKEYKISSFLGSRNIFTTIQSALQITTHGDIPELF